MGLWSGMLYMTWSVLHNVCASFLLRFTGLDLQVGLVIATGAEPSFHLFGFAATVSATSLRALKTVMQVSACW